MKYYAIEGIDFTGKTTQFKLLQEQTKGIELKEVDDEYEGVFNKEDILFVRHPYSASKTLRNDLKKPTKNAPTTEAVNLNYYLELYSLLIGKTSELDNTVIWDRSFISGFVYNDISGYKHMMSKYKPYLNIKPIDKLVFLLILQNDLKERMKTRVLDEIELSGAQWLIEKQNAYLTCIGNLMEDGFIKEAVIINGAKSINEVNKEIREYLEI